MLIFDAHLHADVRSQEDFGRLARAGVRAAVTCAHDWSRISGPDSLFDHFYRLLHVESRRLADNGIVPFVALGIHPQGIPGAGVGDVLASLPSHLEHPQVVAVGEVGLHWATPAERWVLSRQLEIAALHGLPCVVHTPERNKEDITSALLDLIYDLRLDPTLVLIDHVNEKTFELVRNSGCWIGLTVQKGKLSVERAAALVARHGPERVVASSDLGSAPAEVAVLPRLHREMQRLSVPFRARQRVLFENARRFYKLGCSRFRYRAGATPPDQ